MSEKSDDAGYAADFETVRVAENEWIAKRRAAAGLPPPEDDLIGLAFSGGGIRSATFNLGVLQGLEKSGLLRHVDYLSSVSGGGYSASCYLWLRTQLGNAASSASVFSTMLADGSGTVLDWLRGHGKFLVSHRGYSIWTLIASIFAAMFINVLVLGPPLLMTIYAMTLDWLRVQWPEWLALPGAHPLQGHHGYWLLMVAGLACLELTPVVAIVFAFIAGIRSLSSVRRVDYLRVFMGRLIVFGSVLIAIGLIPVAALLGEMAEHFFVSRHAHAIGKHLSYLVPAITGFLSMLLDRRKSGDSSGRLTTIGLSLIVYGLLILCYHIVSHIDLERTPELFWLIALSVVLAFVCDINRVSIHAYYRARLSEAFLPRVREKPDDPGEFRIDDINPDSGAPLQLINTTLNTTSSDNERLSSREGASFFLAGVRGIVADRIPTHRHLCTRRADAIECVHHIRCGHRSGHVRHARASGVVPHGAVQRAARPVGAQSALRASARSIFAVLVDFHRARNARHRSRRKTPTRASVRRRRFRESRHLRTDPPPRTLADRDRRGR